MGQKIRACIREIRDVDLFETPSARGSFVKTLLLIDIKKPLRKGVNKRNKKDGVF